MFARVEGIEPPLEVLETSVLPLYDTRLRQGYGGQARLIFALGYGGQARLHLFWHYYFVSLWGVCFWQCLQNLLNANLSLSVFLFFLE